MCKAWQNIGNTMGVFLEWHDSQGRSIDDKSIPRSACLTGGCVGTVDWRIIQTQGVAPKNAAPAPRSRSSATMAIRRTASPGTTMPNCWRWMTLRIGRNSSPIPLSVHCYPNSAGTSTMPSLVVHISMTPCVGCGVRRATTRTAGDASSRPIEQQLVSAQRSLAELRGRYVAIYPLAHGKPNNGWPTPLAEYRAAYWGDPDFAKGLRAMTDAAKALLIRR